MKEQSMSEKKERSAQTEEQAVPKGDAQRQRLESEALSALKERRLVQKERVGRAFACVKQDDLAGLQAELSDWPTWEADAKRRGEDEDLAFSSDEVASLLMAAIPKSPRCADWLIGQVESAEPPRPQDQDQKPLMRAMVVEPDSPMAAQAAEWFARLIPKSRLDLQDYNGRTVKTRAGANKNPGFVQALLDAGENLDEKDGRGSWAILSASVNGATQTLLALIKGGASVDTIDDKGRDALMRAAFQGTTKSVAILAAHCDLSRVCDAAAAGIEGARGAVSALELALLAVRRDPSGFVNSPRWATVDAIGARLEAQGIATRRQKETLRAAWAMGGFERLPQMAAGREAKMLAQATGLAAKKRAKRVANERGQTANSSTEDKAIAAGAPRARAKPRRM